MKSPTSLPWLTVMHSIHAQAYLRGPNNRSFAVLHADGFPEDRALLEANSNLIVRAVNSHDEMVAALRATLAQLDSVCQWCEHNRYDFVDARKSAPYAESRAALAKAEGCA